MPVCDALLVGEISARKESRIGGEVPLELLFDFEVVVDFGLLDLVEEGLDVLLADVALLVDIQQVVNGEDLLVILRVCNSDCFVVVVVDLGSKLSETGGLGPLQFLSEDDLEDDDVFVEVDELHQGRWSDEWLHLGQLHQALQEVLNAEVRRESWGSRFSRRKRILLLCFAKK